MHATPEASAADRLMMQYAPAPRLKKLEEELNFGKIEVKNRGANGNIVAEHPIKRLARVKS